MSYTRHSFIDQLKKMWNEWSFYKKGWVLGALFCTSLALSTIWDLYSEPRELSSAIANDHSKSWLEKKISGLDRSRYLMAGSVLILSVTLWAIRLSSSMTGRQKEKQEDLKLFFSKDHQNLISKLSNEQLDKILVNWNQTFQELSIIRAASSIKRQVLSSRVQSPDLILSSDQIDLSLGEKVIRRGEVAVLLLAGGQGTRLGYKGPKGCYPITPVRHLSLFGHFAEKLQAAKTKYRSEIPLAIMCSPGNLEASKAHFEKNNYFGLDQETVSFFLQGELPITDSEYRCLLSQNGGVLKGPDGNGTLFHQLDKSGVFAKWKASGVRYVSTIPVDNPLFDPVDEALISGLILNQAPMSAAAIQRIDEHEQVGVFVREGKQTKVLEYSELPKGLNAKDKQGNLSFAFANISIFVWDITFVEKIISTPIQHRLLHRAVKTQETATGMISNLSKWEWFIFDWMEELEEEIPLIIYDRALSFSPLKSLSGRGSMKEVQESLLAKNKYIYEQLTKKRPYEGLFELGGSWYYPSSSFTESILLNLSHPPDLFKGESLSESAFPEQV